MTATPTSLSDLPSINQLLSSAFSQSLIDEFGRDEVKRSARRLLEDYRQGVKQGRLFAVDFESLCGAIEQLIRQESQTGPRRVFNLSGTLLHTNLGRAVLPQVSIDAVIEVMSNECNLEIDLADGKRGERDDHLEQQICRLTGAEAATMVNNNAAAVMLVLNSLALDQDVLVSRGELVEIGGSFRIPDIIAGSGARLVEVGTTNRTHLQDFRSTMDADTAMIMKVHQSNYVIEGFTAAAAEADLAALCGAAKIPFVIDLGSGTLVDLEQFGLPPEPTPMAALNSGADIVTFSGDKLLGGPQAGLILGRRDLIGRINTNPMKRALRCDKMTVAAMSALLRLYTHPQRLADQLPTLEKMLRDPQAMKTRAAPVLNHLTRMFEDTASVALVDCVSQPGSGSLPGRSITSVAIAIRPNQSGRKLDTELEHLASGFRALPIPVIGRIFRGAYLLDLRGLDGIDEFLAQLPQLRTTG